MVSRTLTSLGADTNSRRQRAPRLARTVLHLLPLRALRQLSPDVVHTCDMLGPDTVGENAWFGTGEGSSLKVCYVASDSAAVISLVLFIDVPERNRLVH